MRGGGAAAAIANRQSGQGITESRTPCDNDANDVPIRQRWLDSPQESGNSTFLTSFQSALDQLKRKVSYKKTSASRTMTTASEPQGQNDRDENRSFSGTSLKSFLGVSVVVVGRKRASQNPETRTETAATSNHSELHCSNSPARMGGQSSSGSVIDTVQEEERKRKAVLFMQNSFRRKRYHGCLIRPVLADRLIFDGSLARGARRFLIQLVTFAAYFASLELSGDGLAKCVPLCPQPPVRTAPAIGGARPRGRAR
jgi:hypothetical protein